MLRVGIDRATMRRRWLGTRLAEHREAAGLKGAEVAKRIARAGSTLSRWETGDLIPRPAELYYMLELYGVRADERERLMRHADEAREPGLSEVDESDAVADHVWLESRAWSIETFQTTLVHGLLQSADHARALLMARLPTATPERVERAVVARDLRQRRLTDEAPLRLSAILDEAVLRRIVGGPALMRAQLEHLVERAELPNVEIGVIPFAAGAHTSMSSAFDVLRFRGENDVVFLETRGGITYLERTEPFSEALDGLRAAALSAEQSIAMIARLADEMT
ncbi:MAG: helix-turn-helix domain-containing protein [Solirubrobacteraceae bacterium]